MITEAHMAGLSIEWDGRYLRQRCSWCGVLLLDYDLTLIQFDAATPEDERYPSTWPPGAVIRRDGAVTFVLVEPEDEVKLAEVAPDACVFLDPEATR